MKMFCSPALTFECAVFVTMNRGTDSVRIWHECSLRECNGAKGAVYHRIVVGRGIRAIVDDVGLAY